ncbi:MAG: 4Fe-4S dicluster domain-containing protein [Thermoplasmata archaeon]
MQGEFSIWHGVERGKINWYPIVDPDKCTGCGLCVVTCSEKRNVFGYDKQAHKAVVLYPDNCMVGCNNCQVSCLWDAISYPEDAEYIRNLAKGLNKETLERELSEKLSKTHSLLL